MDALESLAKEVRNWGRWGPDDERGTLNYVTPAKRVAAAREIRSGASFSLSIPFDSRGPQTGAIGRVNPVHLMTATGADPAQAIDLGGGARYTDDYIVMPLQCATQWDALSHVFYGDRLYNGYPAQSVDSSGARFDGIDKVHQDFVSRAVLLDVARLKGVDSLAPSDVISAADLDAAERAQGVRAEEGDFLLVRTGLMASWRKTGGWDAFRGPQPGLHVETLRWIHARRIAAVAADNMMVEAAATLPGYTLPLHMIGIRDMGLSLGEFWYLEELAEDCARDGRWSCFLAAQALRITGAVGSPVNPIAIK